MKKIYGILLNSTLIFNIAVYADSLDNFLFWVYFAFLVACHSFQTQFLIPGINNVVFGSFISDKESQIISDREVIFINAENESRIMINKGFSGSYIQNPDRQNFECYYYRTF